MPSYRLGTIECRQNDAKEIIHCVVKDPEIVKEYSEGEFVSPLRFCDFGFVWGCVWGDDTSWKIQHLDLSRAHEGVLIRTARYGYIEAPKGIENLRDCIELNLDCDKDGSNVKPWWNIGIAQTRRYDMETGQGTDDDDYVYPWKRSRQVEATT